MKENKKSKVRVQAYLSPYLTEKMDEKIEEKGFSSRSDFISYAIQRQILKFERELEKK